MLILAILGGFSLLHASWLAPDPVGRPKLIAAQPVELPRDKNGCFQTAPGATLWNAQYGNNASLEVQMLQLAAGNAADGIVLKTAAKNDRLVLAQEFDFQCARDKARGPASAGGAFTALSKPERFIHVPDADTAKLLSENPPEGDNPAIYFAGNETALQPINGKAAFSIDGARNCASEYKSGGWTGGTPEICKDGTMLLTLGDLGITLWGWPDRFLARMNENNVRLIIAENVDGDRISGLTQLSQYDEIARSYNGYIWIDNIEDLGPALKPDG